MEKRTTHWCTRMVVKSMRQDNRVNVSRLQCKENVPQNGLLYWALEITVVKRLSCHQSKQTASTCRDTIEPYFKTREDWSSSPDSVTWLYAELCQTSIGELNNISKNNFMTTDSRFGKFLFACWLDGLSRICIHSKSKSGTAYAKQFYHSTQIALHWNNYNFNCFIIVIIRQNLGKSIFKILNLFQWWCS